MNGITCAAVFSKIILTLTKISFSDLKNCFFCWDFITFVFPLSFFLFIDFMLFFIELYMLLPSLENFFCILWKYPIFVFYVGPYHSLPSRRCIPSFHVHIRLHKSERQIYYESIVKIIQNSSDLISQNFQNLH